MNKLNKKILKLTASMILISLSCNADTNTICAPVNNTRFKNSETELKKLLLKN